MAIREQIGEPGSYPKSEEYLYEALRRLDFVTEMLRRLGLVSFLLTAVCIVFSFTTALRIAPSLSLYQFYSAIICGILAVVAVMLYESYRKRGEALFEEISDEVQWHVRFLRDETNEPGIPARRPELPARITLRSFAKTTDLPLIPGRYGPAIYAFVNLVSLFLAGWVFRLVL